jgi:ankyrin repeat protein
LDVVRTLLDLGAVVDQTDVAGMTPLIRAVLGNQLEIVRVLIARGANVNQVDNLGMTPLLWAASVDFGDSDVLRSSLRLAYLPQRTTVKEQRLSRLRSGTDIRMSSHCW